MKELLVSTKDLTKKFGDVVAVDKVSMEIYSGEIRGLIGENGSGKSTISQMICGIYSRTSGEIFYKGKEFKPNSYLDAEKNHIAMIVQETGTIDYLTVSENIFLGREKEFTKGIFLNHKKMDEEAKKVMALVGMEDMNVTLPISAYSFEVRKMVEIAKALSIDPELFIVDETTTALSQTGREKIHEIMNDLREKGKAVLFISHDLEELSATCDVLTVLRDGHMITTLEKKDFDADTIKKAMVGREVKGDYYRSDFTPTHGERETLIADHISTLRLHDVSMSVREGEIVGIGGLSDSGMHDLAKAFFGMEKLTSGHVYAYSKRQPTFKEKWKANLAKLKKKPVEEITDIVEYEIKNIDTALKASIGYISKDRDKETLILPDSIKNNLCISNLDNLAVFGVITPRSEKKFAADIIESFHIKCASMNQTVKELSGGNKQKVSFGKWIGNNSKILVFDSPTRGVDVMVKATMYQLFNQLKKEGYTILIVSEELPELIGMSDRILVMKDGKINHEFLRSEDLKEEDIINYMI